MSSNSLLPSEWILALVTLFLIMTLFVISKATSFESLRKQHALVLRPVAQEIEVALRGAVYKEGVYKVLQGTPLASVLRKARPKPMADLKNIPRDLILEESREFEIPFLKTIRVEVCGAVVEKKSIELPAGSRVCDLLEHLELTQRADKKFFRKRRLLKDGEKVAVPERISES